MLTTQSPAYQKAFNKYLRHGTPIERSLKAEAHLTTHYIWHTAGDDKVRPSHAANEGLVFAWNNPPPTGNPGDEYGCRCTAEPYYSFTDKPLEPVYPEFALIPLLRVGRLAAAWRAWALQRNLSREWTLGSHKSAIQWRNRLEKGDWTPEKITTVIRRGNRLDTYNAVNKPNSASRYELGEDFIVVDDITNEVLQISGPGYKASLNPPSPKFFR